MTYIGQHVVVTTAHRGVFFGVVAEHTDDLTTLTLHGAQMAVFWSSDMRGVFGLAVKGPDAGCRIGPPVQSVLVHSVTAIALATETATKRWIAAPWS